MKSTITLDDLQRLVVKLVLAGIPNKTVIIIDADVAQVFDDLNTELEILEY